MAWPLQGTFYDLSTPPKQPLELYSFESSPYCRIAREVLCSLEIPYLLHNVAKGSPHRDAFVERSGKMMVPYLIDPTTGIESYPVITASTRVTATARVRSCGARASPPSRETANSRG